MKKQIICLLCSLLVILFVKAQDRPRKFKVPVVICPVNYAEITTRGITANLITVRIATAPLTLTVGEPIPHNAKLLSPGLAEITDTLFTYTLVSNKKMAFDVIQTVGSFTLIKLWKYHESNNNQLSEYEVYSQQNRGNAIRVPGVIKGIRKVSGPEISSLLAAASITITTATEVDPTKDYYLVKSSDIETKTEEFEYKTNAWNVGLMYLPVKVRPFGTKSGVFDFATDISIGTSFSWTVHHNFRSDWTANLLVYTGVSSVKIDSLIAGDTTLSSKSGSQNVTAFSPAIGMYWEKKNIQLGFLIGMDFLAGRLQKTWAYRGMPWISLTAGINLFKLTGSAGSSNGKNP